MVSSRVLVRSERLEVNIRGVAGHGRELLPGNEPAIPTQGDQLPDTVTVSGNGEGLPVLDGIHDPPT